MLKKKKTKIPYLTGSTNLYRGMHCFDDQCTLKVDKKRHLSDTKRVFDIWIDNAFLEVFGEAARDCAAFCVKNPEIAAKYGNVYEITPIGDFHFYYSNQISDLHDLSWVKRLIYSDKEFDEDQAAALGIRLWTSDKTSDENLKKQICWFFEISPEYDVLNFLLENYPKAGSKFVQDFYSKGTSLDHLKEVKHFSEIMLICDEIQCKLH